MPMSTQERLALSKAAADKFYRKARDYGDLVDVGCTLGKDQLAALRDIGEMPPVTEHIRRAVDLYLESLKD